MAIQPIDLQAIFSQVDKVGKAQSAQREGHAIQQEIQGAQLQKKTEENIKSVNEAQNTGEGVEKVNDRGQHSSGKGSNKEKEPGKKDDNDEGNPLVFIDPCLGRNIDISL